jgi:hypothetical protein
VHGEEPVSAGLKVLPLSVAMMIASVCAGPLHTRLDARAVGLLGQYHGHRVTLGVLTAVSLLAVLASFGGRRKVGSEDRRSRPEALASTTG